ncbi:MAG: hypothetical protein J6Y92_08565 [Lentisphaeria bacterium]|nr:hypothetical protein [Lentisphaeria bacterium]
MNRTLQRIIFFMAVLVLVLDIFGLYVPAKFGTCWLVIPDALENAFCADNFLREGKFGFYLNGVLHPSRYLPWFPLLFLAPFQALTGDVYGAVYGSWAAAAGLAAVMFLSCRQTTVRSGDAGARDLAVGGLAGLLTFPVLLLSSFFIALTGYAMTEVPYLLFCVWAMILWTRLAVRPGVDMPSLMWSAVLIALGGSVRSSAYPMLLLPYILIFAREKDWKRRFLLWFLAALPTALVLLASNIFNWAVFGSPFRTGYHFWCPVPYDFMTLTFHPRYAAEYLPRLVREKGFWLTMALLAVCASWFRASRAARGEKLRSLPRWTAWEASTAFALLQSAIIFVLYIVYFFYDKRMYLPILVMVLPPAASAAAHLLRMILKKRRNVCLLLAGAAIILQIATMHNLNDYHKALRGIPDDRAKLEYLSSILPGNAVLLSKFNPAVADKFFQHGTDRKIIPVNRVHEYTDKIAAPQKVKVCDPPPRNAFDNLAPGLLSQPGCYLPFPYALSDDPAFFEEIMKRNEHIPFYFITGTNRLVPAEIRAVLKYAEADIVGQRNGIIVWQLRGKTPSGEETGMEPEPGLDENGLPD